ncbi:6-phosphogluconolactonase [Pseudonocardia thermophila]|uniref:6-phosphogluconolactonase n=1 Tax=Pseudonocardia thermophila TaxID=1848 RepID=A0A1M6N9Y1_PSETH|nr:6-phosphogluconolactonase [Pseudonocardia thermophila]SHJ92366.1 6-phosphogluconolactonase [Pseudonocardia thermophila]
MSSKSVVVHPDADSLAAAAAARLITKIVDLQAGGGAPRIVLAGGGVAIKMLEHVRESPAAAAIDWSRIELYWGDERYVAPDHPERNELQARRALLDHVPVDPAKVHPMGADTGGPVEEAAAAYAELLAEQAGGSGVPAFDVLLAGMGGEGHTLSVFPDSPAVHETTAGVVAVHDCPKPPPTRISLTLPAARAAAEVWIVTAGGAKAEAVAAALGGAPEVEKPIAGAVGRERTLWLIDREAAGKLPGS